MLLFLVLLYRRYTIFTVIYHVSGGKGKGGESYIYEMLDWRHPGENILLLIKSHQHIQGDLSPPDGTFKLTTVTNLALNM